MRGPDLRLEGQWRRKGHTVIAGVDEAGRGPWAGPVVAAAVIFRDRRVPRGIDDSKALSEPQREALDAEIRAAAWVGIGIADVERIDRDNILQATLWAMRTAVGALDQAPDLALIDGNACPPLGCATVAVVGGDARSLSIAAASIIAKVTRDRIMRDLAVRHPAYGWDDNKGYGTQRHAEGIERAGLTPLHRRSFRPIREYARRFGEPARVACQSDSAGGLI